MPGEPTTRTEDDEGFPPRADARPAAGTLRTAPPPHGDDRGGRAGGRPGRHAVDTVIDDAEPEPGVLVLGVTGAVRAPLADVAERCLGKSPRVLVLDLSRVAVCDGHGVAQLTAVRARARSTGVPVELVVATYEVARALRFSDPDALLGAWPSLELVLTAVRADPVRPTDEVNGRSR
ncbi:STAS domain-containing protein [Saccharothrix australiensis]|uniref:STAS domain-containing protein n=1 Tax=Saccharothrix australiensis TaxID=2072 RepID=A0A495W663_9PSEU|nr:STAS domain-containing protein [Saccharothrix australiensis]RKT56153.1 STAS domain-containing protein [Saccharothrix australiensis]